ncbi:hypothetical protein MAE30S32_31020 [Microcystis aeruginosa 11-30S32]|uniref:Uncharacterized protein n=1 Tax=Microcystis aeruginosa 11-30S32 TaxID=2358142 RepID=A0A510PLI6_MICAE|nr:hypothetical protein MAE30S32_31020 [Microcystis aeruginosa 11-30S32]
MTVKGSLTNRQSQQPPTCLLDQFSPSYVHRKFWVGNPAVERRLYVRIKKTVSKTKWADSTLKTRLREFRSEKLVRVKSRAQQVQEAFSQNRTVGHTESGF